MQASAVAITTPCGADWTEMSPRGARARLCAACDKVVHDLSAMDEDAVRELVAAGPACVRYLYDVHGRILFGGPPAGAKVIPASSLLSKAARSKWAAMAAVAASAIVFEACGGNDGGRGYTEERDAGPAPKATPAPAPVERVPADAGIADDAGDAADAGDEADASPD